MRVMKFGGTSVGDADRMRRVADLVQAALQETRVVVVASAVSGVTNFLVEAAAHASRGNHAAAVRFRGIHAEIRHGLAPDLGPEREAHVADVLEGLAVELDNLLRGVALLRECSPSVLAHLSALGERASCTILAALFRSRGLEVLELDARLMLPCTGDPLEATPLPSDIRARFRDVREGNGDSRARVALLPGFFGGDRNGKTLSLGRGGSDYSAALVAAAVDADLLEIWTDVDGMYSADPRLVPEAFSLPELSFEEAMELSYFGAKVLHPKSIGPVRQRGIPVRVRSTARPERPGTLVLASAAPPPHAVRGISFLKGIALLNITGPGMKGVPGLAARVFGAMAQRDVSIILITQASSECAITFCVREQDAEQAAAALHEAFDAELASGRVDAVETQHGLAILSIVGDGMRARVGVAGTFFGALAAVACNVVAIAQGSSERSISAVVSELAGARAMRHLHHCFFDTREVLELHLLGVGTVGRQFLQQLACQRDKLLVQNVDLRLCSVANSRHRVVAAEGMDPSHAVSALAAADAPSDLAALLACVRERGATQPVLVDCTTSDELAHAYPQLMAAGLHFVTANKKANSSSMALYRAVREAMCRHRRRFMYRTNVGAGLPVIDTVRDLLAGGDTLRRFEGILSGSLSFIFGLLEQGVAFSEAVRAARERGFTEPDHRDDLSGRDVARKVLILHRELGGTLEPEEVQVEGLIPPDFSRGDNVSSFLQRLPELDAGFAARVAKHRERGEVLRFLGTIDETGCRVGVRAVATEHPLYGVRDGENAFSFLTEHYRPRPLVVRGYGAGAEVTAAALLADVIRLVERVTL